MDATPKTKTEVKSISPVEAKPDLSPLTPNEQALANRVASGGSDWQTINERDVNDFSLSEDPFKLPPPALKLQAERKFKFRWYTRTPERVDQVKGFQKIRKWWVVNRTQPVPGVFDDLIDGSTGGIHCYDQLLFFKPWWLWQAEDALDQKIANAQANLVDMDETEKNDLRFAASRRSGKDKSAGRQEVTGSDVMFKGEADYETEIGKSTPAFSQEETDIT